MPCIQCLQQIENAQQEQVNLSASTQGIQKGTLIAYSIYIVDVHLDLRVLRSHPLPIMQGLL
jgi:hypothetical protein